MKDKILEFYVNKFYYFDELNGLDLSFIPPILRRKLSRLDKITLSALNETYSEDVRYIVFSSQYGEADRLIKLISQYKQDKEVSPNTFSGSVHNYGAGFFLLNGSKSAPYTALSACENSVSAGLLASVISNYDNVVYCYSDVYNEQAAAFALNLSKKEMNNSLKYQIKFKNNNYFKDKAGDFIKLFGGEINSVETANYSIERIFND